MKAKKKKSVFKVTRVCMVCKKKFEIWKSLLKTGRGKYCSLKCSLTALNSKPVGWRARKGSLRERENLLVKRMFLSLGE